MPATRFATECMPSGRRSVPPYSRAAPSSSLRTNTVVMPYAGDAAGAGAAIRALAELETIAGDELILVDNSEVAVASALAAAPVRVIAADVEHSPAYARNAGAEHARSDWILFLDADCRARADLLDAYFARPVPDNVGRRALPACCGLPASTPAVGPDPSDACPDGVWP